MNDENSETNMKEPVSRSVNPLLLVGVFLFILAIAGGYYFYSKIGTRGQLKAGGANILNTANLENNTKMGDPVSLGENASVNDEGAVATEVVIESSSFKFMPSSFNVKSGQPVKLTFSNLEGFHDLVFDNLSIKTKQVMAGGSETVEFIAPSTPGEYTFYCSVGQHRQLGMVGKMIVD